MRRFTLLLIVFSALVFAQSKHPLTVDDLWNMKRITTFDVSDDGSKIVFGVESYSMEKDSGNEDIYMINTDGRNLRVIKNFGKNESKPKFIPGQNKITFIEDGKIWECGLDGSNSELLTSIYSKITDYKWSSDGKEILFVAKVYPDCPTQDCNKQKDFEKETSKVKAIIIKSLMFRYWDEWRGDKRSHLFLLDAGTKNFVDITNGSPYDVPPIALGSTNDFNFSPGSNQAAFTMNKSDTLAISTNNDVFIFNLDSLKNDVENKFIKISESKGNDNQPVYSPDGKYIAFASMKTPGYESDKINIILYARETNEYKNLTENFSLSADEFIWSPDSKTIYFNADNQINKSIYKIDIRTSLVKYVVTDNTNKNLHTSSDGKTIFFTKQSSILPEEIFSVNEDGTNLKQITNLNQDILSNIKMNPITTFWSEGPDNVQIQSILVKPPDFDLNKKYPMILLIHGGPKENWLDEFHYRWNLQMFAAPGYVVVAPNPRGSTGYGQEFKSAVTKDWGGKPYYDIINAYNYAIRKLDFIDTKNTFAAGASYGGYMVDWIEGHTNVFNALVSHDGTFNLESMYGTTEELWFLEWELDGKPWQRNSLYEKWSPHKFIQNAKTPLLVIQGGMDYRVPEEQSFQVFTSLQRLGVESKLLYFPDENHFVLKPQNAELWWSTIFDWFKKYRK
jgi:dipeptidyl aminopeptidase/acylaminoacyl peptidase